MPIRKHSCRDFERILHKPQLINMKDLEVLWDKAVDRTKWQDLVEMMGDVTVDIEKSDDSSTEAELNDW